MIILTRNHEYMSCLRMKHAMYKVSFRNNTGSDSGSDGDIHYAPFTLRLSKGCFSQYRTIDIRIKAYRTMQSFLKSLYDRGITPCKLRCAGNIAIFLTFPVQFYRSKACNSQCINILILKIFNYSWYRNFRCFCRNRNLFKDLSLFISDRTYHLCPACFQCS